jgi:hypothetical protein
LLLAKLAEEFDSGENLLFVWTDSASYVRLGQQGNVVEPNMLAGCYDGFLWLRMAEKLEG